MTDEPFASPAFIAADDAWTTTRYDDDVMAVRALVARRTFSAKPTVFFGSSSFRYWHRMAEDLGSLDVANLGFGGGTAESGLRYFDQLFEGLGPGRIVLYFGENDIANDGLDALSAFEGITELVQRIRDRFGPVPIYHLSVKHSPSRWAYAEVFTALNTLVEQSCAGDPQRHHVDVTSCLLGRHGLPMGRYYVADNIHLNAAGYAAWAKVLTGRGGVMPE